MTILTDRECYERHCQYADDYWVLSGGDCYYPVASFMHYRATICVPANVLFGAELAWVLRAWRRLLERVWFRGCL